MSDFNKFCPATSANTNTGGRCPMHQMNDLPCVVCAAALAPIPFSFEPFVASAAPPEDKDAREGLAWLQFLATDAGGAKAPVAQIHKKRLRAIVDALGVALAARPAAAPQEDKTDDLGLSIDMLDVDRLREWARLLLIHGADISHWGSVTYVAGKMQLIATGIEKAVRDIGVLRRPAAPPVLAAPPQDRESIAGDKAEDCGPIRHWLDKGAAKCRCGQLSLAAPPPREDSEALQMSILEVAALMATCTNPAPCPVCLRSISRISELLGRLRLAAPSSQEPTPKG